MSETKIRNVVINDAERLLEIYSYYVTDTAISFEYTVPSLAEFQSRIKRITEKYPYLVVEKDGQIQGYAYAHPFVEREAYDWCCETTIYLDKNARKCGLGRMLYEALEARLKEMGIINLYACIARTDKKDEYLNNNSPEFHEHLGYKTVGEFRKCGYKFGRWYDMIWMEKIIGEHKDDQPKIRYYPELCGYGQSK
ncbi:MAG: GNAT family N-acetyltransferase [Clostridiales bacterium]|jgi:L-amino acid N-acyltransferase YncA|nr:GNAT family N-acetyltransferase [Clostridiales bacterium]